jgi:hypothetical protein
VERRESILTAVDTLIRVHDEWEADPNSPVVPTERFEKAVHLCIGICGEGDIPSDCRDLVAAVVRFGREWDAYSGGRQDNEFRPLGTFWDAFRAMRSARTGRPQYQPRTLESVAILLGQGVSPKQIAYFIYGDNGVGPFVGPRGEVLHDLIDKERREPGSVIPAGWVHPSEVALMQQHEADLTTQLQDFSQELQDADGTDPATIEQLLIEGAFINQICRAKGVTREEVIHIANRLGVIAKDPDNLTTLRAPHEPKITPEQDAALQPHSQPESEAEASSTDIDEDRVMELLASGMTPLQVAQEVGCSAQKVGKIRSKKEKAVTV